MQRVNTVDMSGGCRMVDDVRVTGREVAMVDSRSLQLVLAAAQVQELAGRQLAAALQAKGYEGVSGASLSFLAALECGVNYASEIARRLQVSRQMVAKKVKELSQAGYLEQLAGVGKQKQIRFTARGEQLMADARQLLSQLDRRLEQQLSKAGLAATVAGLAEAQKLLSSLVAEE